MSGVIIVGAGHGGSQLAVSLRAEGYPGSVTLIDRDPALPYHKPPLSKTFLKTLGAEPQILRAAAAYDDAGVNRITGTVTGISPGTQTIAVDGRILPYAELVLATGARNRMLSDLEGAVNVHSLRDLGDATRIRDALSVTERVLVVGGGFIGLETAAALAAIGRKVTVVEAQPRVLARVAAPETSARVEAVLEQLGVDLRTGWQGQGWRRAGGRIAAALGIDEEIRCDLILIGIGAEAETALARDAGIACDNGVLTDSRLSTNIPHIWAIGDVAEVPHWQADGNPRRLESVQNATDQARYLARLLMNGGGAPYRSVPWFWSDIGQLKLQIAGLSEGADRRLVRSEQERLAVFHFRDARLVAVETLNSPADHMLARQLLDSNKSPPDDVLMEGPARIKAWLSGR